MYLIHSKPTSSPDADELRSMDKGFQSKDFNRQRVTTSRAGWERCKRGHLIHANRLCLARIPYSPCIYGPDRPPLPLRRTRTRTTAIITSTRRLSHPVTFIFSPRRNNTTKSKHNSRKTRKPRVTLRVRQPEVNPKPKFMLWLSKPKHVRRG